MLVSQVINSKSIALAATEAASNAIPYLGLSFFPEKKKMGLDLKWIKTNTGLPVTLAPSNFYAIPVLRAIEGLDIEKTQMAFFRESMQISEEDQQEIDRIQDVNDPYLAAAVQSIYNDTNTLLRGAEVVPERMRMSLLATVAGKPVIAIQSGDVHYSYDYDPNGTYAASHYTALTGTSKWSDAANSTPLADLNTAKRSLAAMGKMAKYVLMNSVTFNYLLNSAEVKNNILAINGIATITPTDADVIRVIENRTGLTILIYDKQYVDDAGNTQYFYPSNKVTLLPEGGLGSTWFGTTPEERTGRQVADVDVSIYGAGIAVAVKTVYGPPAEVVTTAAEIVLPSYENMDSTYVIEVA